MMCTIINGFLLLCSSSTNALFCIVLCMRESEWESCDQMPLLQLQLETRLSGIYLFIFFVSYTSHTRIHTRVSVQHTTTTIEIPISFSGWKLCSLASVLLTLVVICIVNIFFLFFFFIKKYFIYFCFFLLFFFRTNFFCGFSSFGFF
jgi:hypothetical protein